MSFSPHAWGWTGSLSGLASQAQVFPTRVGMDRYLSGTLPPARSFPHTRGDGPYGCRPNVCFVHVFPTRVGMDRIRRHIRAHPAAFSPHAWGWTALPGYPRRPGRRFPHTRGDGPFFESIFTSSPAVFPTRVGMDQWKALLRWYDQSFPHTRGDGPTRRSIPNRSMQFSPHAWGWTVFYVEYGFEQEVFPTRVGMDRTRR